MLKVSRWKTILIRHESFYAKEFLSRSDRRKDLIRNEHCRHQMTMKKKMMLIHSFTTVSDRHVTASIVTRPSLGNADARLTIVGNGCWTPSVICCDMRHSCFFTGHTSLETDLTSTDSSSGKKYDTVAVQNSGMTILIQWQRRRKKIVESVGIYRHVEEGTDKRMTGRQSWSSSSLQILMVFIQLELWWCHLMWSRRPDSFTYFVPTNSWFETATIIGPFLYTYVSLSI